ncbi:DUF6249 domain-containing protein [Salmonirosea aquatica]|uniref:DUF6249 domain-containing protein n=1 Tax=Salmonirosea aquatica TaxID=2654236 RepID=A0A7C9FDT0_9BACT|nr:hypothetical protein [Cytophagaceae bacterium SJW1-29]
MNSLAGILIPLGTTYLLFWGIVTIMRVAKESSIKARMVELGHLEPEKQWILQKSASAPDAYSNLKYGILLVCVGAGLMIVNDLNLDHNAPIIFGLLSIVAGLGFLLYFLIIKYLYRKAD